jgi:hypothetical protein
VMTVLLLLALRLCNMFRPPGRDVLIIGDKQAPPCASGIT